MIENVWDENYNTGMNEMALVKQLGELVLI